MVGILTERPSGKRYLSLRSRFIWEFPKIGDPNIVPEIVGSLFKVGGHKVIGDEGETERTDRCCFSHWKFAMIMSNALAVASREESHSR